VKRSEQNDCGEPVGHCTLKALALAVTLSLKLITMLLSTATLVARLAGVVLSTVGAESVGPAVVKLKTKLDAIWSGGSITSVSVI
jgi:hypothetical protein